jgi:putative redox protein
VADAEQMVVSFPGGKRVDADYKGFVVKTDQSQASGGEGAEPAPFDLFLVSLGTCAGIYVLSFCQHRGIPTEGIRLIQNVHRNGESKMVERIDIEIRLPPEFPAKYQGAVVRAAELCAVKKHLAQPPSFSVVATQAALGAGAAG